jgi:hypothetical protein
MSLYFFDFNQKRAEPTKFIKESKTQIFTKSANPMGLALIYLGRRAGGHTRLADATGFNNTHEYIHLRDICK